MGKGGDISGTSVGLMSDLNLLVFILFNSLVWSTGKSGLNKIKLFINKKHNTMYSLCHYKDSRTGVVWWVVLVLSKTLQTVLWMTYNFFLNPDRGLFLLSILIEDESSQTQHLIEMIKKSRLTCGLNVYT